MQEHQVTIEGETMQLPDTFIVIATQNPIEYEGTFPLPEAQLDRFMLKLAVGYPSMAEEQEILKRRRDRHTDDFRLEKVTDGKTLMAMRQVIETVHIEPDLERYIVELVQKTRQDKRVAVGASPRGSLALLKLARASAALESRQYVLPDDIKSLTKPALIHRLILNPELWLRPQAADQILTELIEMIEVPVINDG
jgi:MoxR-like ATPase